MSADGEPINNPEVAKRVGVDRVKGLIKADNLIFREHNVDNPGPNDMDDKARDLIRSFGLEKVETVQQLFDSVNDPNRGHDVPKEKLDILVTAVCESIIEAGKSDIVMAGSSSIDRQLLWTEFRVRDKNNEEAPSFAFMVAEKFRERFSAGDTRNNVTTTMEYLDYVKNSEYGKNGGLEEAADRAYESLLQTKPNVLSKREMQARAAVLKYVSSLRGEGKSTSTGVGEKRGESESKEMVEMLKETVASLNQISTSLSKGTIGGLLGIDEYESNGLFKNLSGETTNPDLSPELKGIKRKDQIKRSYAEAKNDETIELLKKEGIEGIYEKINFIEGGTSNVDDLSRNSEYFKYLYMISNGRYDDVLKNLSLNGKELGLAGVEVLKREINMRMFLHNFYLAASKCHSIEDILRVVGALHEGDLNHDLDREFIKFFLEGKMGLKELPVNQAWDWRQKGYFETGKLKGDIVKDQEKFLAYLNAQVDENNQTTKGNDAARKRIGVDKVEKFHIAQSTGVWDNNIEIPADRDFGIDENILKNFFQIETSGGIEGKIIEEYMLWKMKIDSGCTDENALKAFELAKKLSAATFANSKANIGFTADDYAEMILFKLFRYTESIAKKKVRERKSKPAGASNTIRHIETLTCHWLDLSRKTGDPNDPNTPDGVPLRGIYSPLFSNQIDFNKIVGNGDMAYHFSAIVASQVIPIKEAFIDKVTPKDIGGFNTVNKIFAKINKLSYDLCRAGIKPVYFGDLRNDWEVYSRESRRPDLIDGPSERKVAEKMRKIWVANLFYIMGDDSSGWSSLDTETLIESLLKNDQLIQDSKLPGGSIIPRKELFKLIDSTKVRRKVLNNDIERKMAKGRNTY